MQQAYKLQSRIPHIIIKLQKIHEIIVDKAATSTLRGQVTKRFRSVYEYKTRPTREITRVAPKRYSDTTPT